MPSRWLFGPAPDLLLGCGLAWMATFALQGVVGNDALAAWAPAGILVMVSAIPHYGATLLRVYESAEDRRKYAFFTVYASIGLAALYGVGLYSAAFGSLLLTVYLTWSPWHYTGQNYGISLMLLGRRGVRVAPGTKRWIHASFVLSFLLTFVAIHGAVDTANYAPVSYDGTEFHLIKLGLPAAACALLVPALAAAYAVALAGSLFQLARAGRVRDLAPALALFATQAMWFSVPVVVRQLGIAGRESFFANVLTPYGFIWIAAAHSVQYLWITSYFARTSGADRRLLPYLGKTALAGYAIWTVPALLFAPALLGRLPYESGLALLTAAVVNLHHFVLDGAIWKLRDGRVSRVLLRSAPVGEPVAAPARTRRWVPALVWSAGALSVAVSIVALTADVQRREGLAEHDLSRVREAATDLAWIGRDGPGIYREIGRALAAAGQSDGARTAYRRSLALYPTAGAWVDLASVEEEAGNLDEAMRCLEAALALDPHNVEALYRAGRVQLARGEVDDAVARLERAAELAPDLGIVRATLLRARRSLPN